MWDKHNSVNTAFTVAPQPPKPTCYPHVHHAYPCFREVSPRYVIIGLRVDRKMKEGKISFVMSLYFTVWRLDCCFREASVKVSVTFLC